MEKRLIDANALHPEKYGLHGSDLNNAFRFIEDAPTVDAVEVVRCKECIYANMHVFEKPQYYCPFRKRKEVDADDFCSFGEREERKCK